MNLHYKSIVIDGHNDTTTLVVNEETWLPEKDIGNDTKNQIDLGKLEKGGLDVAMFSAYTGGYYNNTARSLSRTLALLNALYWTEENNKDRFEIVHDSEEILQLFKKKLGAIPTIEGAYAIDNDNYYELLRQFRDLGVKLIGFNWNYSNNLGEGIGQVYSDGKTKSEGGLTELGKKTLMEMRKLGMGIDVSHVNEKTFWGIVEHVNNPIIATHSGVYNIREHKRNLKDEQLQAIRDSNGMVGVVFYPSFITDKEKAYVKDIVEHIDYITNLIGIDHVGLGSDFDGASLPEDMKDSSEIYKITDKLIEIGYSDEDIKKILGENYLRVFRELEENRDIVEGLDLSINNKDDLTARYILDGLVIKESEVEDEDLEFDLKFPNNEKFHIFTVELKDESGKIKRNTKIIVNDRTNS